MLMTAVLAEENIVDIDFDNTMK